VDVPFVPAVPDGDLLPIPGPVHLEMAQGTLFKYLHAVGFYGDLDVGRSCPGTELLFSIFLSHDHDVQGLVSPEIAYGHLM
jgi:hypothetical protein